MMSGWGGFCAETRMVVRQTLFRVALVVSLGLTIFWHRTSPFLTSWTLAAGLVQDYQGLLGAVAVLTGALVGMREANERVTVWLDSLPHERGSWLTGKFVGGMGPVFVIALAAVMMLAFLQYMAGAAPVRWWIYGQHLLVFFVPTLLFFYTLGYVSGRLVSSPRLAYVLALSLWVVAYPLLEPVWAASTHPLSSLGRVLPVGRATDYAEITGYGADWPLILYHRGVYLALSGVALLSVIARARAMTRRLGAALLLMLLALVVSGGGYARVMWSRHQHYESEAAGLAVVERDHHPQLQWDETGQPIGPGRGLRVLNYDMSIELDLTHSHLENQVRLHCVNQGNAPLSELEFTLRHDLSIVAVRDGSGKPLNHLRQSDALVIHPLSPLAVGEHLELDIQYEGHLEHWRGDGGQLRQVYRIGPQGVYLPSSYGWYPVAGEHLLAHVQTWDYAGESHERIDDGAAFHAPSEFNVVLTGGEELTVVAVGEQHSDEQGLFLSTGPIPGFSLIAGNYAKTAVDPIVVYHHPDAQSSAEALAENLSHLARVYDSYLERAQGFSLIVAQSPVGGTAFRPLMPSELALIRDTALHAWYGNALSEQALLDVAEPIWFYRSTPWGNVQSYLDFGVMSFLQALYRTQLWGPEHWHSEWSYRLALEEQGLDRGQRLMTVDRDIISGRHFCADSNRVWLLLAQVRDEHGDEASMGLAQALLAIDPVRGLWPGELESLVETVLP